MKKPSWVSFFPPHYSAQVLSLNDPHLDKKKAGGLGSGFCLSYDRSLVLGLFDRGPDQAGQIAGCGGCYRRFPAWKGCEVSTETKLSGCIELCQRQ